MATTLSFVRSSQWAVHGAGTTATVPSHSRIDVMLPEFDRLRLPGRWIPRTRVVDIGCTSPTALSRCADCTFRSRNSVIRSTSLIGSTKRSWYWTVKTLLDETLHSPSTFASHSARWSCSHCSGVARSQPWALVERSVRERIDSLMGGRCG